MKPPHNRAITIGDRSARGDDPWMEKELEAIAAERAAIRNYQRQMERNRAKKERRARRKRRQRRNLHQ